MTQSYQPGIHADRFRSLPAAQRDAINQQANAVFAQRTGVRRKLNPKTDRHLCQQWLQIRDEVIAGSGREVSLRGLANHIERLSPISTLQQFGRDVADHYMAPWMTIARAEEKRNVVEIPGKKHHPRIMDYIRTCDTLYATANKAKYTEREGEEGVKWCSAFVNWCMC